MPERLTAQVAKRLRAEFRTDEIVERPDHPLLLRGPDMLVGGDGSMAAIFVPHALETNNPAHLASRLIASRLALPYNIKTVLLLDQFSKERFATYAFDFALVVEPADRHLGTFIRDRADFGSSAPMDPATQSITVKQFDVAYSGSEIAFRVARTLRKKDIARRPVSKGKRESVRIQSGLLTYQPQNRVLLAEGEASILSARTLHNLRRQLVATSSGHLLENYALDRGVPIPRRSAVHVAIADHADEVFGFRSSAIAGAAFAGVSIAPADDVEVAYAAFARTGVMSEAVLWPR